MINIITVTTIPMIIVVFINLILHYLIKKIIIINFIISFIINFIITYFNGESVVVGAGVVVSGTDVVVTGI